MTPVNRAEQGSLIRDARPDAALIDKGDLGIATYAMLFVIVVLVIDRWFDRRSADRRTAELAKATEKLALAVDAMTEGHSDRNTVQLVHNARIEAVMGRVDVALTRMERDHVGQ